MVNKPLLSILALIILIIPLANAAVDVDYVFKINQDADIKVACFDVDNTLCTNATACYITINNPNGANIVNKQAMTFNEAYYNYTIKGYMLNREGEYSTTVNCIGAYNGYTSFLFGITSSGERKEGSGIMIFGMIALAFVFLIVGILTENVVFTIVSAIIFIIDGLVFITTGVGGLDSKFTMGIGIILVVVGAFVAIVAFKAD